MNSQNALSTVDHILVVADRFSHIANVLHTRLTSGKIGVEKVYSTTDLYGLLIEEYGLRARTAILHNDAAAHVVGNTMVGQAELMEALEKAGEAIAELEKVTDLRSVIASVSTLCVGISPNKGRVIDFLVTDLRKELKDLRSI